MLEKFSCARKAMQGVVLLWLLAGLVSPSSVAAAASKTKEAGKHSAKIEENIFTNRTVRTLRIELRKEDVARLRNYQWGNGNRIEARATVREGDLAYTNVAVHL